MTIQKILQSIYDGDMDDIEPGLDSIEEILELLAKDGKKYSVDELLEMQDKRWSWRNLCCKKF